MAKYFVMTSPMLAGVGDSDIDWDDDMENVRVCFDVTATIQPQPGLEPVTMTQSLEYEFSPETQAVALIRNYCLSIDPSAPPPVKASASYRSKEFAMALDSQIDVKKIKKEARAWWADTAAVEAHLATQLSGGDILGLLDQLK